MARRRSHSETDKITLDPYREQATVVDVVDDEDITKPHSLPSLMRPDRDPATVEDLREVFRELWDRIDRHRRAKRDTDRQLKDVSNIPGQVRSLAWRMKIIWWVGGVLLAGTAANLIAGAKYLYGRGSSDAEQALTQRLLVESNTDLGKRLRTVEDASIKLIQRFDDYIRHGRADATTGSSPRGGSKP